MRIINITAHKGYRHTDETINSLSGGTETFRLMCGDVVLVEEDAPYDADDYELEQWAGEKLKGLFDVL